MVSSLYCEMNEDVKYMELGHNAISGEMCSPLAIVNQDVGVYVSLLRVWLVKIKGLGCTQSTALSSFSIL